MICGKPWVLAREPLLNIILLGGLGVLGVGEMWVKEEAHHTNYEGYKTAVLRGPTPNEMCSC